MTDYDMSVYDVMKPSINQYVNLLADCNKRLVNIKNNKISLERRKGVAFEIISKEVLKLHGEELQKWKDKLENVFNPKKTEKVKNDLKIETDFTGYEIGEDVIYFTKYNWGVREYKIRVKCRIKKFNKYSITLQKYCCNVDFTDERRAAQEQTYGRILFNWTDKLRDKDNVVVKDITKIMRRGDRLFNNYIKTSTYFVDYGD